MYGVMARRDRATGRRIRGHLAALHSDFDSLESGFKAASHSARCRSAAAGWGVDSAAVQDGFELYLHGFFVTADGKWTVVQQDMNEGKRQVRRYHWHSAAVQDFVDQPHSAIDGRPPCGSSGKNRGPHG